LGRILKKRYPDLKNVSFEDLLGWSLWPNFIQIYGKLSTLSRAEKTYYRMILAILQAVNPS